MLISTSICGTVRPSVDPSVDPSVSPLRLFIFGGIDELISTAWPVLALVSIRSERAFTFVSRVQLYNLHTLLDG